MCRLAPGGEKLSKLKVAAFRVGGAGAFGSVALLGRPAGVIDAIFSHGFPIPGVDSGNK